MDDGNKGENGTNQEHLQQTPECTEAAVQGDEGTYQLVENACSVDEAIDNSTDMENSLNSSSITTELSRASNITEFSVLSYLTNPTSSLEPSTQWNPSRFSIETVDSDNTADHTNGPGVIPGSECDQLVREREAGMLVQSTDTNMLDCKMGNGSDISFDITQQQNLEVKDDSCSKKRIFALNQQRIKDNIDNMTMVLSFPTKNPVTVYSVLQCLERAHFSSPEELSTATDSTTNHVPTNTCDIAENLTTKPGDRAQIVSTNTCDISQILSTTNTGDTTLALATHTGDATLPLATNTGDTEQLVSTSTPDKIYNCNKYKYNLRNKTKISYNIDHLSDDDTSEHVTSESDYLESDKESNPSISSDVGIIPLEDEHTASDIDYLESDEESNDSSSSLNIPSEQKKRTQVVRKSTSKETVIAERHSLQYIEFDKVMTWKASFVCPVCKQVCESLAQFEEHFLRSSYKCANTYRNCAGNAYTCSLCNYTGMSRNHILDHLISKRHNMQEAVNFPTGSLSTKPARTLERSAQRLTGINKTSTDVGLSHEETSVSSYHLTSDTKLIPTTYSKTKDDSQGIPAVNKELMNASVRVPQPDNFSLGYCCQMCGSILGSRWSATRHLKNVHSKTKVATCRVCNTTCFDKRSLHDHMKLHNTKTHLGILINRHSIQHLKFDEVMKWNSCHVCPVCKHVLGNLAEFEEHLRWPNKCQNTYRDNDGKGYTCSLCDYQCKGSNDMLHHLISKRHNMHEAVNFQTNPCSNKPVYTLERSSYTKPIPTTYSKTKDGIEALPAVNKEHESMNIDTTTSLSEDSCMGYCCQKCGSILCSRKSAVRHLKNIHSIIGVATCHVCNETCSDKQSLRNHMKRHNMEKYYNISGTKSFSSYGDEESKDSDLGNIPLVNKGNPTIDVQIETTQTIQSCDKLQGRHTCAEHTARTTPNTPRDELKNRFPNQTPSISKGNVAKERRSIQDMEFDEVMKWNACHVCPVCKHVSENLNEFDKHFRSSYKCPNTYRHSDGKGYTCSLCNYKGKSRYNILHHLVSKHHNLQEAVNFKTGDSKVIPAANKTHDSLHVGDPLSADLSLGYCCQICGSVLSSRKNAIRHLKIHSKRKFATCHMQRHNTKTYFDKSGVSSSLDNADSDDLNSRSNVKDTLPECHYVDPVPTTDKQATKVGNGTTISTESYTAISKHHDASHPTETEHTYIQHGTDSITVNPNDSQKYGDKESLASQMDIAKWTQDTDDKPLSNVRPAIAIENTAENQGKPCFAFETSKFTKNVLFEQTVDYQGYREFDQLLKWNASHTCPVCKTLSENIKDFHAHFVKSITCKRFFLDTSTSGARYSCQPCSYLNRKFDKFIRHLILKKKHGELTCMSFPTSNNRTDSDEEYGSEAKPSCKDSIADHSVINARDGDGLLIQRQSEKQRTNQQSAAGINMDTCQSTPFRVGFTCPLCGAVRFKMSDARIHLIRHTGDTIYECQTCKDHLILKGKFDPEHMCGNCGSTHFKLRSKSTGKVVSHSIQKAYECLVCNEHLFDPDDLNVHMQHHVETECTCGRCSKTCLQSAKAEAERHVKLQNKCDFCEKVFKCKLSLDLHYQSHSESVKPFMCDTCGEKFANRACLSTHIRRKHLNTKYCQICKKRVNRDVFKSHMKSHPPRSRYTCDQCGKMFKFPHHLTNHLLSHTNKRSFICKHCGYAFKMKHHMESHILTQHMGVTNLPVMKNREGATRKPEATKTKRKVSTCQKRIDDKSGKATMTKRKRKRTTNSSSAAETDIPKRKLRRHHLNENGED